MQKVYLFFATYDITTVVSAVTTKQEILQNTTENPLSVTNLSLLVVMSLSSVALHKGKKDSEETDS
jgi:hypothetical protein